MTVKIRNHRSWLTLFFVISVLMTLMPLTIVRAEGVAPRKCDCFCATTTGAIPPGDGTLAQSLMTTSECQVACKAKGNKVAVCAFGATQYPSEDVSCFTPELCAKAVKGYCGDTDQVASANETGRYSPISCLPGSIDETFDTYQPPACLPGRHFCYAPRNSTRVRLNIQIGDTSYVNDIEKYISVVYQWMVTAGITFAVVLIMVGGVQYVLGAASPPQIKKGQDRIKNAVIGLILLLSAILIIETVSPKLSSIAVPRLPLIKTRELAGQGKSCEQIATDKFTIGVESSGPGSIFTMYKGQPSPSFQCGKTGTILKGPDDSEVVAGLTCGFQSCPKDSALGQTTERCVGSGPTAKCLTCGQIYDDSPELVGTGIIPSATTCGKFTKGVTAGTAEAPGTIERCGWSKDGDLTNDAGAIKADSNGACGYFAIDCKSIKTCQDYARVKVSNVAEGNNFLWEIDTEPGEIAGCLGSCSDFSFRMICNEDPCGLFKRGCKYDDVNDLQPWERCTSYYTKD